MTYQNSYASTDATPISLRCVGCDSQIGTYENEWIRLTASYARPKENGTAVGTEIGARIQIVPTGSTQKAAEGCAMSEVFCNRCSIVVGQYCRSAPDTEQQSLVNQYYYKLTRVYMKSLQTAERVDPVFAYNPDAASNLDRTSRISRPGAVHRTSFPSMSKRVVSSSRPSLPPVHPQKYIKTGSRFQTHQLSPAGPSSQFADHEVHESSQELLEPDPTMNDLALTERNDDLSDQSRMTAAQQEQLCVQQVQLNDTMAQVQGLNKSLNQLTTAVERLQSRSAIQSLSVPTGRGFIDNLEIMVKAMRSAQDELGELEVLREENKMLRTKLQNIAAAMGTAFDLPPAVVSESTRRGSTEQIAHVLGKRKRGEVQDFVADNERRRSRPRGLPTSEHNVQERRDQIPTPRSSQGSELFAARVETPVFEDSNGTDFEHEAAGGTEREIVQERHSPLGQSDALSKSQERESDALRSLRAVGFTAAQEEVRPPEDDTSVHAAVFDPLVADTQLVDAEDLTTADKPGPVPRRKSSQAGMLTINEAEPTPSTTLRSPKDQAAEQPLSGKAYETQTAVSDVSGHGNNTKAATPDASSITINVLAQVSPTIVDPIDFSDDELSLPQAATSVPHVPQRKALSQTPVAAGQRSMALSIEPRSSTTTPGTSRRTGVKSVQPQKTGVRMTTIRTPEMYRKQAETGAKKLPRQSVESAAREREEELVALGLSEWIGKDRKSKEFRDAVDAARSRQRAVNKAAQLLNHGIDPSVGSTKVTPMILAAARDLNTPPVAEPSPDLTIEYEQPYLQGVLKIPKSTASKKKETMQKKPDNQQVGMDLHSAQNDGATPPSARTSPGVLSVEAPATPVLRPVSRAAMGPDVEKDVQVAESTHTTEDAGAGAAATTNTTTTVPPDSESAHKPARRRKSAKTDGDAPPTKPLNRLKAAPRGSKPVSKRPFKPAPDEDEAAEQPPSKKAAPVPKRKARTSKRKSETQTPVQEAGHDDKVTVNEDNCTTCGKGGNLLCCDGCPKVYHHKCLSPPMNPKEELVGDWFCPMCKDRAPETTTGQEVEQVKQTEKSPPPPKTREEMLMERDRLVKETMDREEAMEARNH